MTADLTSVDVGTELPPLAIEPIDRTTLALFAGASNDHNPIHVDIDVAHSAGLDDVFVHGMLTMAYLSRLLLNWAGQDRLRSYAVRFTAITPVHAEPTCRGTVVAITEVDGERRADLELSVVIGDGTIVIKGTAQVALD